MHTAASGAAPGSTDSADAGAADQQGGTATGSSPAAAAQTDTRPDAPQARANPGAAEADQTQSTPVEAAKAAHPAGQAGRSAAASAAPAPPADLWTRLRGGFGIHARDHKRIDQQVRWYARHPRYLDRVFQRARPYLHWIVEQVEKRHMPTEIALLPVVESAFRPFAYSHGRAAGLWQFIPATGRRFGLKQDWWYDGRRDVIDSTEAALDYLKQLYSDCGNDWLLALAAYNSGEGTVLSAMRYNKRRGRPTDFWHLRLPRETQAYVPKLLALRRVVENPEKFGITLKPIKDTPHLTEVDTGGQIDLALAAKLAKLPLKQIYHLNPGFNRWATDPKGPHRLVLPVHAAKRFEKGLDDLPKHARVRWARHRVHRGQTLSGIAARYHTTVALLKRVNKLRGTTIRAGHYLVIPVARRKLNAYALSESQRRRRAQSRRHGRVKVRYTVHPGDTLWDIARHYRVKTRRLAAWNGMAPRDYLHVGQKLVVWLPVSGHARHSRGGPPMAVVQPVHYTVRRGDNLSAISQRFRVTVPQLRRWNNLPKHRYLQPGQKLKLYVDVTHQADNS